MSRDATFLTRLVEGVHRAAHLGRLRITEGIRSSSLLRCVPEVLNPVGRDVVVTRVTGSFRRAAFLARLHAGLRYNSIKSHVRDLRRGFNSARDFFLDEVADALAADDMGDPVQQRGVAWALYGSFVRGKTVDDFRHLFDQAKKVLAWLLGKAARAPRRRPLPPPPGAIPHLRIHPEVLKAHLVRMGHGVPNNRWLIAAAAAGVTLVIRTAGMYHVVRGKHGQADPDGTGVRGGAGRGGGAGAHGGRDGNARDDRDLNVRPRVHNVPCRPSAADRDW